MRDTQTVTQSSWSTWALSMSIRNSNRYITRTPIKVSGISTSFYTSRIPSSHTTEAISSCRTQPKIACKNSNQISCIIYLLIGWLLWMNYRKEERIYSDIPLDSSVSFPVSERRNAGIIKERDRILPRERRGSRTHAVLTRCDSKRDSYECACDRIRRIRHVQVRESSVSWLDQAGFLANLRLLGWRIEDSRCEHCAVRSFVWNRPCVLSGERTASCGGRLAERVYFREGTPHGLAWKSRRTWLCWEVQ